MSRCFPYPPPGYTLSKASNDAVIESIKKSKKKKAKDEKKERKKSKKEKKENKGKEEMPQSKDVNISHELYDIFQKVGKEEIGQWEKSCITEELGLPCSSQDPSNSSDSTQNSNKRKRHESPLNAGHTEVNVLRFRLSSQKQMDCKSISEVEFQRTFGIVDLTNKNHDAAHLNKLPSVSKPTKPTTVESSKAQTNSTTVESVKESVDYIAVELCSGESSKAPMDSIAIKLLSGESSETPMISKTVKLLPCELSKSPMKNNTVKLLPGELSKAPTLLSGESSKAPTLLSGELSKAPMKSNTVKLLPGESSKSPNKSAIQQNGVIPRENHHNHVSKKSKKQHKAAKKYEKIIDHIPLMQADKTMDYEEDWLCKKNLSESEVKLQIHNQISCASSSLLWPRAQYLHEADLYSLPYSIPF